MTRRFTTADLMAAGESYHHSPDPVEHYYPELVLAPSGKRIEEKIDSAVRFLGPWKALRFRGGATKLKAEYHPWCRDYGWIIEGLHGKRLQGLQPNDFGLIAWAAAGLRERGIPSTATGKLLHFLVPDSILLWDRDVIRDGYHLKDDPFSFVSYQCFGWRLLRSLRRSEGSEAFRNLEEKHAGAVGYREPLTKILDELAYSTDLASKAVSAIGGQVDAFRLVPPTT